MKRIFTKQFLISAGTLVFFFALVYFGASLINIETTQGKVSEAGIYGPLLFIFVKISTIILAPLAGTPLYLMATPLFGVTKGAIYIFIGDLIGYSVAFYISRIFGKRILQSLLSESQYTKLDSFIDRIATWKSLLATRVVLLNLQDVISYASGLTKIPFWQYLLVTVPIIVASIMFYLGIGSVFIKNERSFAVVVLLFSIMPFILILLKLTRKDKKPGPEKPSL